MHSIQLPNYKDFLDLFDPEIGKPVSTNEMTSKNEYVKGLFFNDRSYTYAYNINPDVRMLVQKLIDDVRNVCNKFFKDWGAPYRLTHTVRGHTSPALIHYMPGGGCNAHDHARGPHCYSAVLTIEDIDHNMFYIDQDNKRYTFPDKAGEIKLFRSDCYMHGVYPVPQLRRVMVLDYEYREGGLQDTNWQHNPLAMTFKNEIN